MEGHHVTQCIALLLFSKCPTAFTLTALYTELYQEYVCRTRFVVAAHLSLCPSWTISWRSVGRSAHESHRCRSTWVAVSPPPATPP
eukprot:scaffold732_cov60-Phaeocystis_antarctica.AAC.27